jgi:hypothetical protein
VDNEEMKRVKGYLSIPWFLVFLGVLALSDKMRSRVSLHKGINPATET